MESCALSTLFFSRLILAWMKIEVNGKAAATMQKRSGRIVARGVWRLAPLLINGGGDNEKSRSLRGGFVLRWLRRWLLSDEGGKDHERSDNCDGECVRGIDRRIKMSARTCQGLTCRTCIAYDNVRPNQLVPLQSLPRRIPSPSRRAGIVFGYTRAESRGYFTVKFRRDLWELSSNVWENDKCFPFGIKFIKIISLPLLSMQQ